MSTIPNFENKQPLWQNVGTLTLGFWLSACLLLDAVIMPSLYASGMMVKSEFASAGYTIFSVFNRIELLCAALVLTGILTTLKLHKYEGMRDKIAIVFSIVLMAVVLIDTYGLTPQMGALGMQLNMFESATEVPNVMNQMHAGYWMLEMIKLAAGTIVLGWFLKNQDFMAAE
jgi:hypothetical protein